MGAGRKTSTYDVDTKSSAGTPSFEEARRNLGEAGKLGGVVFGEHGHALQAIRRAVGCSLSFD